MNNKYKIAMIFTILKFISYQLFLIFCICTFSYLKSQMMEACMENPGLLHIGERILKSLHFNSQANCRLVKRSWNQILEKEVTKKTRTDLVNLLKSINEFAILPEYIDTNVLKYYKNVAKYDKNKTLMHFGTQSVILPDYEMLEKFNRLVSWKHFVMGMTFSVNNHMINILLKKHIRYQINVGFPYFPLEHFVSKRDMKMIDLTLKQKLLYCDPEKPNIYLDYIRFAESDFNWALLEAIKNRYSDIVQRFKPFMMYKHQRNNVFMETRCGNLDVLKLFYPNPKESLMVDPYGLNPIHIAASNGRIKIVKYFIENTEALTAQDNSGCTPLCGAIINCRYTVFRIIIKAVSEEHILKPLINGMNVIHVAAERVQFEVVYQLCKKVTNPIVPDDKGNTPIHYAACNGNLAMLKFLTSYGTDLMIPNKNGKTPLELAEANGHIKVAKHLMEFERKQIEGKKSK